MYDYYVWLKEIQLVHRERQGEKKKRKLSWYFRPIYPYQVMSVCWKSGLKLHFKLPFIIGSSARMPC